MTIRSAFLWSCWIPGVTWAAALLYVRSYEGWGAWAAALSLLPGLVLSGLWAAVGAILLSSAALRQQKVDLAVLGATLVGGSMVLYYTFSYLA